jgi:hypothetical protein
MPVQMLVALQLCTAKTISRLSESLIHAFLGAWLVWGY